MPGVETTVAGSKSGGGPGARTETARTAVAAIGRFGPLLANTVLPFVLVLYLALQGGGFGVVVRSEVGIAIWWIVLLGAVAGLLPATRVTRGGWVALGLLVALTAWTGLAMAWTDSEERTILELSRIATYVGVFALALLAQGRAALEGTVRAIAAASALVALLALGSRLHPQWFPTDEVPQFLDGPTRLSYPLNYWNGLATLMAIGIPLVVVVAAESRRLLTKALATAVLPIMALVAFYTLSRGGALAIAVGVAALLALHPRRLAMLPTLTLGAVGSALAIIVAYQREDLLDGPVGSAPGQADEMIIALALLCAGVALVAAGLGLAARHGLGPSVSVPRRVVAPALAVLVAVLAIGALVAGAPSELSQRWEEFKDPAISQGVERFESASGRGRYQTWETAVSANASAPLIGIGPGSYELWWAREGTLPWFVRDAHSLYLETLAELGIVGLALLLAALGALLAPALRAVRARSPRRAWMAAALAASAALLVSAAIDWTWELPVLPVAFLLLAAAMLNSGEKRTARTQRARPAIVMLALACLVAISLPLLGAISLRESQAHVRAGNLEAAASDALAAENIQPFAASPLMQSALVLELGGELDAAAAAARDATAKEPENWQTWLILARIEAERGNVDEALDAYRRSRSLNPSSPIFQQ